MNSKVIVAFSALLLFIASAQTSLAQDSCPKPRLISVTGTAEINVAPDEVILSLGVETHDKELSIAKSQNDARSKKNISMARSVGVDPKEIETSALTLSPEYTREKIPRFLGYEVSQTIAITLKDLSKYEVLMAKFIGAGINRIDDIDFRVSETRKYRDEARSKAIRAAKEKAGAMAAELGQTIGKPWEISEQTGWNAYQATANSVGYNTPRVEDNESTVAPGQVTIRASVKVSFQLE